MEARELLVKDGGILVKRQVKPEGVRFGAELRRYRLNSGLTQTQVASAIHMSNSILSGFERGTHWPGRSTAENLDRVTKASGQLLKLWVELSNRQAYPDWLGELLEAEQRATLIRDYAPLVIPGLLQTEDYARTVLRAEDGLAMPKQIEEMVLGRMRRQKVWESPDAPLMMTVVAESVLTSPTGGASVMAAQLDHLIARVEQRRIRLQVVPSDTQLRPGLAGMFILLSFRNRSDVLYVESAIAGTIVHDVNQVQRMSILFSDLQGVALSPERSLKRLHEMRREFHGTPEAVA